MKNNAIFLSVCFLILSGMISAQDSSRFSKEELDILTERWTRLQPYADVVLNDGDTLVGQPLHLNLEEGTLALWPSNNLPLNMDGIRYIPLPDIKRVVLNRGGRSTLALTTGITIGITAGILGGFAISGPGAALILGNIGGGGMGLIAKGIHNGQTYAELDLNPVYLDYENDLKKLHDWSVFEDSVVLTDNIQDLPEESRAVRNDFQPRHFRISFGVNGGFNGRVEENVLDQFQSAGFSRPQESYHYNFGFEFVDLAWRFNNRWIAGGGLMKNGERLFSIQYYNPNYNEPGLEHYEIWMDLIDYRIYGEYVLWPIEWFPLKRTELLVGGGFIISRPDTYHSSYYLRDTITYEGDYIENADKQTVFGAQLRTSFHVYVAQSVSFSVGLEGNLYQNMEIPAVELPGNDPDIPDVFPALNLNYSTVRLKAGVHISF